MQREAVCSGLVNSRRDRGMEEWSYQRRSDEGLGSSQDKHTPAKNEQQQHTHTHTFLNFTLHTCTNAQIHEAASAWYPSHASTHTCRKLNSVMCVPPTTTSWVLSCVTTDWAVILTSPFITYYISPFAQIPQSKHVEKRNGCSFIFKRGINRVKPSENPSWQSGLKSFAIIINPKSLPCRTHLMVQYNTCPFHCFRSRAFGVCACDWASSVSCEAMDVLLRLVFSQRRPSPKP